MKNNFTYSAALLALFALSACGGGGLESATDQVDEMIADAALDIAEEAIADAAAPSFKVAPVLLQEPDDIDSRSPSASALRPAASFGMPSRTALGISPMSVEQLGISPAAVSPFATARAVTYTPAQIRAAYGMGAIPAAGTAMTREQAAQLGAGQTIYIVNAYNNPNVLQELAAFNQKFGLPQCAIRAIPTTATLPLAPALTTEGCSISVVYSDANGKMTAVAPKYDASWATEVALDVQWAHATAPHARIVLILGANAGVTTLSNAVKLANSMGPGVVSMSFGALEGSWSAALESTFTGAGMTYAAATGDWGTQVNWPSSSPNVLAVGGTSLTYSASSAARSEVGWSKTGGGISSFSSAPAYQMNSMPGIGSPSKRMVADVAFNSDPLTGQYMVRIIPGSTSQSWMSAGGTSLAAPQWAGIMAVTNARRALNSQPRITLAQPYLYAGIAGVPGNYAAAFADIQSGSNGTCTICTAKIGYDGLTGIGTPNVDKMVNLLSPGGSYVPIVSSGTISARAGVALQFKATVTSAAPVTWSLSAAPSGMNIDSSGNVSWTSPVVGSYTVNVQARDTATGAIGTGTYYISVTAPPAPPAITSAPMTGTRGVPLTGSFSVTDPNRLAMSISITGVRVGMVFSLSGNTITAKWPKPAAGNFTLKVTVKNSAGFTTTASIPITIK